MTMLRPQPITPVPDETARVARAAFRKGNLYMRMRDELGTLYTDDAFAALFPSRGRPAEAPWRLALVTVMQYVEGLSDQQAADAVRARIDWKYSLSLALTDPGFDASVLSEFRTRLVNGGLEQQMLDLMLAHFRERKLLKARGEQRTDSTHVLAAIRTIIRLECVGETLRHTLNSLAIVAPDWLRAHSDPEWVDRYGSRVDDARLPQEAQERQAYAALIGADGSRLLSALYAGDAPPWLREVPAVQTLRRVWVQQFYQEDEQVHWRSDDRGLPPSALESGLCLRTACDLVMDGDLRVTRGDLVVPSTADLAGRLPELIEECRRMGLFANPAVTTLIYDPATGERRSKKGANAAIDSTQGGAEH
jgi:transposase